MESSEQYAKQILIQKQDWSEECLTELLADEWTAEALLKATYLGYESPADIELVSYWDKRYLIETHIWGDEPSNTAKLLGEELQPASRILEVGFGYGRDLFELVLQGHKVTGVEISMVSFAMANTSYQRLKQRFQGSGIGMAEILRANFTGATLGEFDAVFSHRTIHLIYEPGLLRSFVNSAKRSTREGGLFFFSARDDRDFDPEQMEWLDLEGENLRVARYINRPDHKISFRNEERCRRIFGKYFELIYAKEDEEVESLTNGGKTAKITIFAMRRKHHSEIQAGAVSG